MKYPTIWEKMFAEHITKKDAIQTYIEYFVNQ